MKRLHIGAFLAVLAFVVWACKGDPTSSLRGGPALLSVTPGAFFVKAGSDPLPMVVIPRDAQLNPVALDVAAATANAAIATVKVDTSRVFVDGATHAFLVTPTGTAGQSTYILVTGGSLKDSSRVTIN